MTSLDQVEDGLEDANENSLKLCPFCGGKADFFEIEKGRDKGAHFIQCTEPLCEASTNLQWSLMEDARPLLAERWNRRAVRFEVLAPKPISENPLVMPPRKLKL